MAVNPLALPVDLLIKVNNSFTPLIIKEYLAEDYIFSKFVTTLIIGAYSFLAFTGIVSNLNIIAVIVMHPKLRTGSTLLVLSLNVSDFLVSLIVAPLTMVNVLRRNWTLGDALCRMTPMVQGLQIFVSALTITTIALDRMMRITNQRQLVRPGRGAKSVWISTAVIWSIALLLSLPVALNSSVITIGEPETLILSRCVEMWTRTSRAYYTLITIVTQLILPTVTLILCYLKISSFLKRQAYRQPEETRSDSTPSPTPNLVQQTELPLLRSEAAAEPQKAIIAHHRQYKLDTCMPIPVPRLVRMVDNRNRKALLVLIAIWLSFTFTWLPWNLFNVYVDFTPEINLQAPELNLLFMVFHLLAISSPTSNAILYGWFNTNIRLKLVANMKKCVKLFNQLPAITTSTAV